MKQEIIIRHNKKLYRQQTNTRLAPESDGRNDGKSGDRKRRREGRRKTKRNAERKAGGNAGGNAGKRTRRNAAKAVTKGGEGANNRNKLYDRAFGKPYDKRNKGGAAAAEIAAGRPAEIGPGGSRSGAADRKKSRAEESRAEENRAEESRAENQGKSAQEKCSGEVLRSRRVKDCAVRDRPGRTR